MANSTIVSVSENDTGRGLMSEVLSIPLLTRGKPSAFLLTDSDMSTSLGFPTLSRSKPFSSLLQGGPIIGFLPTLTDGSTTLGKFLPEILR